MRPGKPVPAIYPRQMSLDAQEISRVDSSPVLARRRRTNCHTGRRLCICVHINFVHVHDVLLPSASRFAFGFVRLQWLILLAECSGAQAQSYRRSKKKHAGRTEGGFLTQQQYNSGGGTCDTVRHTKGTHTTQQYHDSRDNEVMGQINGDVSCVFTSGLLYAPCPYHKSCSRGTDQSMVMERTGRKGRLRNKHLISECRLYFRILWCTK